MLLNWFTVAAQIVNFLILVALLKHFLYDRIIQAMDQREKNLHSRMEEAEEKQSEARREADDFRKRRHELEEDRERLISEARKEVERQKKDLQRMAREEVDAERRGWEASLERERTSFLRDLQQMAAREVYATARSMIRDLAGQDLEGAIVAHFVHRLQTLDEAETREMAHAVKDSGKGLTIRSRFDLTPELKRRVTAAFHKGLDQDLDIHYETDPEMLPGIEATGYGHKLTWSTASYLDEMEDRAGSFLSRLDSQASGKDTGSKGEEAP
ncbi:MAG: hypothetical protein ACOWYE_04905 [Desulfatiglandales bacterium]